ncbi:MAG: hypothetical protein J4F42_15015 [Desulfurellaceae bacterium]|nr:hypothetical protein [Desulfurellaceae bacterium]
MSFWLRLCLGLVILAPSLTVAQEQEQEQEIEGRLEIPSQGDTLSGIGVISGWKCEAEGAITVRVDDANPLPTLYGLSREDTEETCGDTDNGFVTYFNWGLLGDGTYTVAALDNGKKFDSSTVRVATFGEEFVEDADPGPFTILDFPSLGEKAEFVWNTSTQHLELLSLSQVNFQDAYGGLKIPEGRPPSPAPLLPPPPLPCARDETSYRGDTYLIRFDPDFLFGADLPIACAAPRGIIQVEVQEGRFSVSADAPPHGVFRFSGEVCDKESGSLFVGGWSLNDSYQGYFTGSLADLEGINCPSRWQDTAGCTGDLLITPLPKP